MSPDDRLYAASLLRPKNRDSTWQSVVGFLALLSVRWEKTTTESEKGAGMPVRLSDSEFDRRREVIRAKMQERSLDALCVFSPAQVFYVTGFSFIATERPIGAIYRPGRDSVSLFVPLLEGEHAEDARVDLVHTYDEYPGKTHPMKHFARLLVDLELEGSRIGVDADGYAGGYGLSLIHI